MESIVEKEIESLNLDAYKTNDCLKISYLSMLRVWNIIKFIYKHKEFEKLKLVDEFYKKIKIRVINNDEIPLEELDKYLDACEEVIPEIENCNINEFTLEEGIIMNLAYSIIEELFYYISIQSKDIKEIENNSCKSFIFLPATVIETFLRDKYYESGSNEEKVNDNKLLKDEIDRINSDIISVVNNEDIVQKIDIYSEMMLI